MTLDLQLPTEIEAQLRQQASAEGLDVAAFVIQAVAEKLADAGPARERSQNAKEWREKLGKIIELHSTAAQVVDDSRESIYAGRGE